jgi:hypothetical protein
MIIGDPQVFIISENRSVIPFKSGLICMCTLYDAGEAGYPLTRAFKRDILRYPGKGVARAGRRDVFQIKIRVSEFPRLVS